MGRNHELHSHEFETNADEIWYDPFTGALGFGKTYGEHSFNNRPMNVVWGKRGIRQFLNQEKPTDPASGESNPSDTK